MLVAVEAHPGGAVCPGNLFELVLQDGRICIVSLIAYKLVSQILSIRIIVRQYDASGRRAAHDGGIAHIVRIRPGLYGKDKVCQASIVRGVEYEVARVLWTALGRAGIYKPRIVGHRGAVGQPVGKEGQDGRIALILFEQVHANLVVL